MDLSHHSGLPQPVQIGVCWIYVFGSPVPAQCLSGGWMDGWMDGWLAGWRKPINQLTSSSLPVAFFKNNKLALIPILPIKTMLIMK